VPGEGAAAALGVVLSGLVLLVWIANPHAAALLLPAVHLWLFASAPGGRAGRAGRARKIAAVVAGLALPFALVAHYASALALGPVGIAWLVFLAVAGGHVTPYGALALAVFGGCLAATVAVARTRRRVVERMASDEPIVTRGPAGYAGPGSLGGTKSALRR